MTHWSGFSFRDLHAHAFVTQFLQQGCSSSNKAAPPNSAAHSGPLGAILFKITTGGVLVSSLLW